MPTIQELPDRDALGAFLPQRGVGCEMGVMDGSHAASLLKHANPRRLHLVDFWSSHHRPEWKEYHQAVVDRFGGDERVVIHDADVNIVLPQFRDAYLDWCYIDTWHGYEAVKRDIALALPKLKPGGILCGHDFKVHPRDWRTGVVRSVIETIQEGLAVMVAVTNVEFAEWVLRKSNESH